MEKVLIVDDSIVQAAQLKSILEDDYDVTSVQTAQAGLDAAEKIAGAGHHPAPAGDPYHQSGRH